MADGVDILTGSILIFPPLDEMHFLERNVHTAEMLRQIRGLDKDVGRDSILSFAFRKAP